MKTNVIPFPAGGVAGVKRTPRPVTRQPHRPSRLAIQPEPLIVQVGYLPLGGQTATAITRRWAESKTRGCRLCQAGTCGAYKGVCTVLVAGEIGADEAKWFDGSGLPWVGNGNALRVAEGVAQ